MLGTGGQSREGGNKRNQLTLWSAIWESSAFTTTQPVGYGETRVHLCECVCENVCACVLGGGVMRKERIGELFPPTQGDLTVVKSGTEAKEARSRLHV